MRHFSLKVHRVESVQYSGVLVNVSFMLKKINCETTQSMNNFHNMDNSVEQCSPSGILIVDDVGFLCNV
jgi:hypothetical protein